MFLRLADGVQETMAQSRWPVEHAYARSAENLLLRRRLDEMVEGAQDELGRALRTHLAAALRDQAANAARPPEAGAEDEEATELDKATRVEKKYSWWPHTDHRLKRAHAVEGRLLALLYYLIRDDAARWQQYVLENGDGDGEGAAARPYYERLHFAGHSRGTIYGVLLGQRYSLQRIVLLDGPTNRLGNHMSKGRTSVPPWLTYNRSRTRPEDYFGLSCTYGGCHACYDAQPIWHDGLRMPGAANFTNESVWVGGGGTMHAHMNGQGHHHHHNLSRLLDGARQVYDSGLCQFHPPSDASHMCLLGHLRKGDGRDYHGLTRIWPKSFVNLKNRITHTHSNT